MAKLYGTIGMNNSDRLFANTEGARLVYARTEEILADHNATVMASMALLVGDTTEEYTERYKLPVANFMQRRGQQSPVGVVRGDTGYDVAFPLEDFGEAIATDFVEMGYLTLGEFDRHVSNILTNDKMTLRYELLKSVFNKDPWSFVDKRNGTLTVQRLASGDTTVYPPIIGATSGTTENHYIGTSYLTAAISDTNNPVQIIVDELEEHFGAPTGGSRIVVFINPAESPKIKALTDFTDVTDIGVMPGSDTATVRDIPPELLRGSWKVLGRCNGAWVVEWRYIPATYMFGTHLDAERPVVMRVDPAWTGLPQGLTMVADEERFPHEKWTWVHRFGFGVRNRLNGVAIHLSGASTYTTPTIYQ